MAAKSARKASDYGYSGQYDKVVFESEYVSRFTSVTKFNKPSIPDLVFVLRKIEADRRITDLRWAAYMLATTFVESSHTEKFRVPAKHGKGHEKARTVKVWRNFKPIEEIGHGRGHAYYYPAKVKLLQNGDAQVTERDGDQWAVSAKTGVLRAGDSSAARGLEDLAAAPVARYVKDDGEEKKYFGRGYVQLTWWDNYVTAGFALGRGLDLLFNPDLLLEPNLAYQIMSLGMLTGKSFANGRSFKRYFIGGHSDYLGARMMVNPGASHKNKAEVAEIATKFEDVLFASRSSVVAAGAA